MRIKHQRAQRLEVLVLARFQSQLVVFVGRRRGSVIDRPVNRRQACVALGNFKRRFPGYRGNGDEAEFLVFKGFQLQCGLQGHDRVQRPARGLGQAVLRSIWSSHGPVATDESSAVGLVSRQHQLSIPVDQEVQQDGRGVVPVSRPPGEQKATDGGNEFAADKQLAEGGVPFVL